MPTPKNRTAETTTTDKPAKSTKSSSPFKNQAEFEKELKDFANKFKTTVVNQATRISDYFEMSCYNLIVKYYELNKYKIKVENLQGGQYRYKCSPMGTQSNFSYFKVETESKSIKFVFEIQHNIAVQSSQDPQLFTTPDISVIKEGSVKYKTDYYDTKTNFSYIENNDLMTFFEVKQFNPFPELLFNFMGIVNELQHRILSNTLLDNSTVHLAPSLMISGKPSKPVSRIKDSLERRYNINVIFDLFYSSTKTFSSHNLSNLRKTGKIKRS